MLHSYTKIFVHLVWATKGREKYILKSIRPLLDNHLTDNAKKNNILIDSLNVQIDHVHVLIILASDQKVDDIVRLLKGESSHWINAENIIPQKFSWQRGYGAFSVSPSHLRAVREYISNQDEHHRKNTFLEEYKTILEKYGFNAPVIDEY